MTAALPPYISRQDILDRLPGIFPEGTPHRSYCIRELAASTVFSMLYIGAVAGTGVWAGPKHVYRMTVEQAADPSDAARTAYAAALESRQAVLSGTRWYADNTREPIRDETLRDGLVAVGAVIARDDLPTTSGRPRYALEPGFAALFDPHLTGDALHARLRAWQDSHLSTAALNRITLIRRGAVAGPDQGLLVSFPNGETRRLAAGPSSVITKAVIETFAPRFLQHPAVLWLSESGNKVVARDDALARDIGLSIAADRVLPDIILVDLGPDRPLLVFVEVVATDGAITAARREALLASAQAAGFSPADTAFLTAYQDRQSAGFGKTARHLAWGSFAWFLSEPECLVTLHAGPPRHLSTFTR